LHSVKFSIAVRVSFSIFGPFQFANCAARTTAAHRFRYGILADFIAGLRQSWILADFGTGPTLRRRVCLQMALFRKPLRFRPLKAGFQLRFLRLDWPYTEPSVFLDTLPIRETVVVCQYSPDVPPFMCGSPPPTEARPSRTSCNRSKRPPDGLDGRSWRSTAMKGSAARRRDEWHSMPVARVVDGTSRRPFLFVLPSIRTPILRHRAAKVDLPVIL